MGIFFHFKSQSNFILKLSDIATINVTIDFANTFGSDNAIKNSAKDKPIRRGKQYNAFI